MPLITLMHKTKTITVRPRRMPIYGFLLINDRDKLFLGDMRPILKLLEGFNIKNAKPDELSDKYKECLYAFDDLQTYRQAHMVSQNQLHQISALTEVSKNQLEQIIAL